MMIGRICVIKSTGKLIEFQSDTPELGTLTKNAINAGYNKNDIVERYVDADEWNTFEKKIQEEHKKEIDQSILDIINTSEQDMSYLNTVISKQEYTQDDITQAIKKEAEILKKTINYITYKK